MKTRQPQEALKEKSSGQRARPAQGLGGWRGKGKEGKDGHVRGAERSKRDGAHHQVKEASEIAVARMNARLHEPLSR